MESALIKGFAQQPGLGCCRAGGAAFLGREHPWLGWAAAWGRPLRQPHTHGGRSHSGGEGLGDNGEEKQSCQQRFICTP